MPYKGWNDSTNALFKKGPDLRVPASDANEAKALYVFFSMWEPSDDCFRNNQTKQIVSTLVEVTSDVFTTVRKGELGNGSIFFFSPKFSSFYVNTMDAKLQCFLWAIFPCSEQAATVGRIAL